MNNMVYFYILISLVILPFFNAQQDVQTSTTISTIIADSSVNEDRTQFTFTFSSTDIQKLEEGDFIFEILKDNEDAFTVTDYTFTLAYSKNVTTNSELYAGVMNTGFKLKMSPLKESVEEITQIILSKDNGVITKVVDINNTNYSIDGELFTFEDDVDLRKYSSGNYSIIYINQCGTKVDTGSLWEIKPNDIKSSSFDVENNVLWEENKAMEFTLTLQTKITEDVNMKIIFSDVENSKNKYEFTLGTSTAGTMTIDEYGKVIITVDKTNTAFIGTFEVSVEYPDIKESFPYKNKVLITTGSLGLFKADINGKIVKLNTLMDNINIHFTSILSKSRIKSFTCTFPNGDITDTITYEVQNTVISINDYTPFSQQGKYTFTIEEALTQKKIEFNVYVISKVEYHIINKNLTGGDSITFEISVDSQLDVEDALLNELISKIAMKDDESITFEIQSITEQSTTNSTINLLLKSANGVALKSKKYKGIELYDQYGELIISQLTPIILLNKDGISNDDLIIKELIIQQAIGELVLSFTEPIFTEYKDYITLSPSSFSIKSINEASHSITITSEDIKQLGTYNLSLSGDIINVNVVIRVVDKECDPPEVPNAQNQCVPCSKINEQTPFYYNGICESQNTDYYTIDTLTHVYFDSCNDIPKMFSNYSTIKLYADVTNKKCYPDTCPPDMKTFDYHCYKSCSQTNGAFYENKDGTCTAKCDDSSYTHIQNMKCVNSCEDIDNNNELTFYYSKNSKQCTNECEYAHYNKTCYPTCYNVDGELFHVKGHGEKECVPSCDESYYVFNNTCYDTCYNLNLTNAGEKLYHYEQDKTCKRNCTFHNNTHCFDICPMFAEKHPNRANWDYTYACIDKCNDNQYDDRGICLESCGEVGKVSYGKRCYHSCKDVDGVEKYLKSPTSYECVDECLEGEFLYKNVCYQNCPSNTFKQGNQCVEHCDFTYNGECLPQCYPEFGFYEGTTGTTCQAICREDGQYFYNENCVPSCDNIEEDDDYYKQVKACVKDCVNGYGIDEKNKQCTQCSGKLWGRLCLDKCPPGTVGDFPEKCYVPGETEDNENDNEEPCKDYCYSEGTVQCKLWNHKPICECKSGYYGIACQTKGNERAISEASKSIWNINDKLNGGSLRDHKFISEIINLYTLLNSLSFQSTRKIVDEYITEIKELSIKTRNLLLSNNNSIKDEKMSYLVMLLVQLEILK